MVVMKFGGTSVESATAIRRVAEIVRSRQKQDTRDLHAQKLTSIENWNSRGTLTR